MAKLSQELLEFLGEDSEIRQPFIQTQQRTEGEVTSFPDEPEPEKVEEDRDSFLDSVARTRRSNEPFSWMPTEDEYNKEVASEWQDNIEKSRMNYAVRKFYVDNADYFAKYGIEPDYMSPIFRERVPTMGLQTGAWLMKGVEQITDRMSKGVATLWGQEEGAKALGEILRASAGALTWIASAVYSERGGFPSYNEYMKYVSGAVGLDDIDYTQIVDAPAYWLGPEFFKDMFKGVVLNSDDVKTTYEQADVLWNTMMPDEVEGVENIGKNASKFLYAFAAETLSSAPATFGKGSQAIKKAKAAKKAEMILGNEPYTPYELRLLGKYFQGDEIYKAPRWLVRQELGPLRQIDGMTDMVGYGTRTMTRYQMLERNTAKAMRIKAQFQDNPEYHSAVKKIVDSLEGYKPEQAAWEAYKKSDLHRKLSKASYIRDRVGGEAGAMAARGAMKGKLDRTMLKIDLSHVTQKEWDALYDGLRFLDETEIQTAQDVITLLKEGEIPPAGALQLYMDKVGADSLDIAQAIIKAMPEEYSTPISYVDETLGFFRATKSAYDMSAVLNQGGFAARTHTDEFLDTYKTIVSAFLKEPGKAAEHVLNWAKYSPNANKYKAMGIEITRTGKRIAKVGKREEQFISEFARKIPGMKISEDFHSSFLNMLRMNLADQQIRLLNAAGAPDEAYKAVGKYVNVMTGRGTLPKNKFGDFMKFALWAPKYTASKFEVYKHMLSSTPEVRKLAIRDVLQYHYANNRMMALAEAYGNATGEFKVGTDPLNSDYGKIITPDDVRRDILGAYSQPQRLIGVILTGYRTSRITGEEFDVGRLPEITRFFEGKLDPAISALMEFTLKRDFTGKQMSEKTKFDIFKDNFLPIFAGEVIDLAQYSEDKFMLPIDSMLAMHGQSIAAYEPDYRALMHMEKVSAAWETYGKPLNELNPAEAEAIVKSLPIVNDNYRTFERLSSSIGKVTDTSLIVRRSVKDQKSILKALPDDLAKELKRINADTFVGRELPQRISPTHNMTPEQYADFKTKIVRHFRNLNDRAMPYPDVYDDMTDNERFDFYKRNYDTAVTLAFTDMKALQYR